MTQKEYDEIVDIVQESLCDWGTDSKTRERGNRCAREILNQIEELIDSDVPVPFTPMPEITKTEYRE